MKYVAILLLGILVGGGAAIFFLGAPPAKAAPGQAVQAPDQGGNPPGTVVIGLDQSFVDAVLATTFRAWARRPFSWARRMTAPSVSSTRYFRVAAPTRSRSCRKEVVRRLACSFATATFTRRLLLPEATTSPVVVCSSKAGLKRVSSSLSTRRSRPFSGTSMLTA